MARIRTIKPEFWIDEKLAPLTPIERLTFLGLISMADDAGRLVDNLKQIDAFVFAETNDTCREALATLSRIGRVIRGKTKSGQKVIQITNWSRHQKVDRPNLLAALPEICENAEEIDIRDTFATNSRGPREDLATLPTTYDLLPTTNDQIPVCLKSKKYPDDFEEFWKAFPSARKQDKGDAFKSWKNAVKIESPEVIISAAKEYAESDVAKGEYVKGPSPWLNKRCWEDDRDAWRNKSTNHQPGSQFLTPARQREENMRQTRQRILEMEQAAGGQFPLIGERK